MTTSVATRFLVGGTYISSGSGSPEGVVTGNVGDIYLRTNGSSGATLYVKESGSGNTGWAAPATGGGGSISTSTDVERLVRAQAGWGVYSGAVCSEDAGGPSMDIDVTAGHIRRGDTQVGVLVTAGATTLATADATHPRIDLVWANDAGTLGNTTGTPAAVPTAPALPANVVLLCMVDVAAGDTTIVNANITDKRVRGHWPQVRPCTSNVTKNANTTLIDIPGLNFTVAAGEEWTADVHISGASGATPDLQFDWTFSGTGSFMRFEVFGMDIAAITSLVTQRQLFGSAIGMGGRNGLAAGYKMQVTAVGVTVGGIAQVQFAQNTSNASDSVISTKASVLVAYPMVLP